MGKLSGKFPVMSKTSRRKKKSPPKASRPRAIRAALEKKNWQQCDLAKEMGVSPPTVSRWLTGERVPDRDHIRKLCELLDIEPGLLL